MVPVGSPSITSVSLPGLTITPVTITPSFSSSGTLAPNTTISPVVSRSASELLKTCSKTDTVSDFSRMNFGSFSNLGYDNAIFQYNKMIAESLFLSKPSTSSGTTNKDVNAPME